MSDLDQARVGKARQVKSAEAHLRNVMRRRVNWTIVSYPNEGWAETIFGEPDVERLWKDVERSPSASTSPIPVAGVERAHRAARARVPRAERATASTRCASTAPAPI